MQTVGVLLWLESCTLSANQIPGPKIILYIVYTTSNNIFSESVLQQWTWRAWVCSRGVTALTHEGLQRCVWRGLYKPFDPSTMFSDLTWIWHEAVFTLFTLTHESSLYKAVSARGAASNNKYEYIEVRGKLYYSRWSVVLSEASLTGLHFKWISQVSYSYVRSPSASGSCQGQISCLKLSIIILQ